jgi:hypothetical protein
VTEDELFEDVRYWKGRADAAEAQLSEAVAAERERCAQIAISFGEFPGSRLVKDLRVMCGGAIADKIREAPADTSQIGNRK